MSVSDHAVSQTDTDSCTARWTARLENGETVYRHSGTGRTTTDTEYVAAQLNSGEQ